MNKEKNLASSVNFIISQKQNDHFGNGKETKRIIKLIERKKVGING